MSTVVPLRLSLSPLSARTCNVREGWKTSVSMQNFPFQTAISVQFRYSYRYIEHVYTNIAVDKSRCSQITLRCPTSYTCTINTRNVGWTIAGYFRGLPTLPLGLNPGLRAGWSAESSVDCSHQHHRPQSSPASSTRCLGILCPVTLTCSHTKSSFSLALTLWY